jgi:WD40 repeat protein
LFCDEAAAGQSLPLGGLSGAPVIAISSGEVLGLIRWNPTASDAPQLALGGQVFACPARTLVEHVPALASAYNPVVAPRTVLFGVPDLPPHFVARDAQVGIATEAVLRTSGPPVGLYGMGGAGKSVVARAVAHRLARPDMHDSSRPLTIPEIVLWLDVRAINGNLDDNAELLRLQGILARALGTAGTDAAFRDPVEGSMALRRLLDGRGCLLILDDARCAEAVQPFIGMGDGCRLMITTRDLGLLRMLGAVECPVDVLPDELALALLSRWSGYEAQDLPHEAREVAAECGGLPLALAMAGAMVRRRSWDDVLARLRGADLERIRAKFVDYPQHHTLLRAIEAGALELVDDPECPVENPVERYVELAVFREAGAFPEAAAQTLWREAGVDPADAVDLVVLLLDRSLIQRDALGYLHLHDLQYDYAVAMAGVRVGEFHANLVNGYSRLCSDGWATGPSDGYFHEHLAQHLRAAGRLEEVRALLTDFEWLYARISEQALTQLLGDFRLIENDEPAQSIENLLRSAADVISTDVSQLPGQIVGRLQAYAAPAIRQLVSQAKAWRGRPWLCPATPSLLPPQQLRVRRLPSIGASTAAPVVSRDGSVAATASFSKLAVWRPLDSLPPEMVSASGASVTALALTSDGSLLAVARSGGYLGVLRTSDCQEIEATQVADKRLSSVAVNTDGTQVVYGTDDDAVGIWDRSTGVKARVENAHQKELKNVWVLAPGQDFAISWASQEVALWKLREGQLTLLLRQATVPGLPPIALNPHNSAAVVYTREAKESARPVYAEAIWDFKRMGTFQRPITAASTPNGVLIFTDDGLVVTSRHLGGISMHSLVNVEATPARNQTATDESVNRIGFLAHSIAAISKEPRRIVSASRDGALYLWDVPTRTDDPRQVGVHGTGVPALAISEDANHAMSISWDGTVAVWDLSDTLPYERTKIPFTGIAVTPDGHRAVAGSTDGRVQLLDSDTFTPVPIAEHLTLRLAITADGRTAVSGGSFGEVRVWDVPIHAGDQAQLRTEMRPPERTLTDGLVRAVAVTPGGGRVLWGLNDGTLAWSGLGPGAQPVSTQLHSEAIESVALDAHGRYGVSGSHDGTVALWLLGEHLQPNVIERFTRRASAVAITPKGDRILAACESGAYSPGPGLSLIDIASGEIRRSRINDFIIALALDEDAKMAVGASYDGDLVVWDTASFLPLTRFHGDAPIRFCCFGESNHQIIAADLFGAIHRLQLIGPNIVHDRTE